MKSLKLRLLFEANAKRPSGLGKIKDKSEEKDVEFIAGDVYDLSGDNRYTDKFKYYRGEGDGYIMDKDGNYYDVITSTWSSDAGRIAGGSMNYQVIIKKANGTDDAIFSGYSAIFSSSHGTEIISDIEAGYYLEDYIAKNWSYLSKREKFEELKKKGNAEAKSHKQEKIEKKQEKDVEFAKRYIILPKYVSFYIKEGNLEFKNFSPRYIELEGKPENAPCALRRNDFDSEEAYNAAREELDNQWKEYNAKVKEVLDKLIEPLYKVSIKLTEEYFKRSISDLNGLEFGIVCKNTDIDLIAIAIDTKKNKLVTLKRNRKKSGFGAYTDFKDVNENPSFDLNSVACVNKDKASDYLKDLFQKVSAAWQKQNSRTKTKYIEDNWEKIWREGRGYYSWNPDKYSKGQAKKIAEENFFKWLNDFNWNSSKKTIEFSIDFIKDFIDDKLPVESEETKSEESKPEEKKESPKFTGKLAEQEKKMDAWHAGTRKQNVEACSDAKLKVNYDICKQKGYDKEAAELKKEADARGLTLESLNLDEIKLTLKDYFELI